MNGKLYCPTFVTKQQYRRWLNQQVQSGTVTIAHLKSIKDSIAYVGGHQYPRVLKRARSWAQSQ